jgi:2-dehydro-3-deoxyphosphogluconate aldolase/(4S)-4-hydroxy-2-oxoglutarate aldolase
MPGFFTRTTLACMKPDEFIEFYRTARASAILRTHLTDAAAPAMNAAISAGFRVLEFTLTVPEALARISEFASRRDIVVGAGTVLTAHQARAAVKAGARFLVSPVVDEAVIEEAKSLNVAMMPGCYSPTELLRAHRAGAGLQKLFPAPEPLPAFIKSVLGPLPFLRIVPTNGVHENNAMAVLKSGAFAVGFVNNLFDPNDLAQGAFDRVEERGRRMLAACGGGAAGG